GECTNSRRDLGLIQVDAEGMLHAEATRFLQEPLARPRSEVEEAGGLAQRSIELSHLRHRDRRGDATARQSRVVAMKVDTGIMAGALDDIAVRARELEDIGYDGLITAETASDPFLPLVIAAEHTERIELGTGIAVAFARTPMLTAYTANDLQRHSKGRFFLGLG